MNPDAPPYEPNPPPYSEAAAVGHPHPQSGGANAKQGHPEQAWNPPPPTWGPNPPPPPPGWTPYPPSYGAITEEPHHMHTVTQVILVGGCPSCRVGVLEEEFSCLGLLCAVFFFPLGILCCLAMRDKRCTNCGARY